MKPLNITIISSTPYAPPWSEGVRNLYRRMAHDFIQRGARITVIGTGSPTAITRGDAGELVINVPPIAPKWIRGIAQSRVWLATAWSVYWLDPEPDVMLLGASVTSALGLRTSLLKIGSRRPLVLYITGLGRPRMGYRWGLNADRVLVGNEFLQQWFPGAGIIHPFLPINVTRDSVSQKKQDDTFNVLFLGSFDPMRGVEYLLQAMALVTERTERRVKLIIAWNGEGIDNYGNILRLIETLGIHPIVDLRGSVDTSMIYHEADILVIPRASQERMAFPVRILEALHMRKPMVVTRICGMEDLVEECGLAVEPRDADGMARAILNLVHDETLLNQLEVNCERVAKRFDSRLSLDKLFNELSTIADNE